MENTAQRGHNNSSESCNTIETSLQRGMAVRRLTAPLPPEPAWRVESLLVRIFERLDYSVRAALSGAYGQTLGCTAILAERHGEPVAAAMSLYRRHNPIVAVMGPVAVRKDCRGKGVGRMIVAELVSFLENQHVRAIYLGVGRSHPARQLYEKVGFEPYNGVIMRRLSNPYRQGFDQTCFADESVIRIRPISWGDMPGLCELLSFPCRIYTFDLCRGLFSGRYVPPEKFLPVIPALMRRLSQGGALGRVLVTAASESVVGVAWLQKAEHVPLQHTARLDFYVHDNFIGSAGLLVSHVLAQAATLNVEKVRFWALHCDRIKRNCIESLSAHPVARLPAYARIENRYEDAVIYEMSV